MLTMQPKGNDAENGEDNHDIPFDGFVNVNDIVKKRRSLRDAGFANDGDNGPGSSEENLEDN